MIIMLTTGTGHDDVHGKK